jgi:hypothetical protein
MSTLDLQSPLPHQGRDRVGVEKPNAALTLALSQRERGRINSPHSEGEGTKNATLQIE